MDLEQHRITETIKNLYNREASEDVQLANAGGKIYGEDLELLPPELVRAAYGCSHPALHVSDACSRILDLGCGQGVDSYLLRLKKKEAAHITGLDLAYEMVRKAQNHAGRNNFVCGAGERLPFKDKSFDCVISNAVIHLSTGKTQLFRELERVLQSPGELVCGDIMLERGNNMNPMVRDEFISSQGLFLYGGIIPEDIYFSHCFEAGFDRIEIVEKRNIGDLEKAVGLFIRKSRMSGRQSKKLLRWAKETTMNVVIYKAGKEFGITRNIPCPSCMAMIPMTIAEDIERICISERVLKRIDEKRINYIRCVQCGFEKEIGIPFVYRSLDAVYHVFPEVCAPEEKLLSRNLDSMINSMEGSIKLPPQKLVFGFKNFLELVKEGS